MGKKFLALGVCILFSINLLFIINDVSQSKNIPNNIFSKRIEYSTPGTGVSWDMDDLVANSNGNVTYDSGNYMIHNYTKISENDILTINPGTILKMGRNSSIRVYGTLIAKGEKGNMITITQDPIGSEWPDKFQDHWHGILFFDTCDFKNCILEYCIIEHACNSVVTFDAPIKIINNIITSRFHGISVHGIPPIINNNTINCDRTTLSFDNSINAKVNNCKFISSEYRCIQVFRSPLRMKNCTFNTTSSYDLEIVKESQIYLYNTTIKNTKIYLGDQISKIFINWYLKIKIKNKINNPLSDAKIIVNDFNGTEIANQTSDLKGFSKNIECIEYELRDLNADTDCLDGGEVIYHTPHQIIVEKEGYGKFVNDIWSDFDKEIIVILKEPPILVKDIPNTYSLNEDWGDGEKLIDLEEFFWDDLDDEQLNFDVTYEENNLLLAAEVNGHHLDFFQKKENWYGTLEFQVKATDGDQLESLSNRFNVTVNPTNDPPVIRDINGKVVDNNPLEFILVQNKYFNATINVTEIDGERLSFENNISLSKFYLNYQNGSIIFLPSNADVGIIYMNITVIDKNNTKDTANITFIIENINDKPEMPKIISPLHLNTFKTTGFIIFNGTCDDKDFHIEDSEEELRFIWWSSINGKLGEGPLLDNILLTEGKHNITLEVIDKGGLNNTKSIIINVIKDDISVIIVPPFCTLLSPKDGQIINTLSINLAWETNFTKPEMITYNVFFDSHLNPRTLIAEQINGTKIFINDLEDGRTYYWTIIPYLGEIQGNCTSGVREFKVDLDYVPGGDVSKDSYFEISIMISIIIIVIIIFIFSFIYRRKRIRQELLSKKAVTIKPRLSQSTILTSEQISQQPIIDQEEDMTEKERP